MKLQLNLICRPGSRIPFNYQYELSAWIYRTLASGDPAFTEWLHQQGYTLEGQKRFKFFTFSHLQLRPPFQPEPQRQSIRLDSGRASLVLSFLLDDSLHHFITGLFQKLHFGIGNPQFYPAEFTVDTVEILPKPAFQETMRYKALSPLCLGASEEGTPHAQYRSPTSPDYAGLLLNNLIHKLQTAGHYTPTWAQQQATTMESPQLSLRLLSEPRKKGITLKSHTAQQTQVVGYLFNFELTAPAQLQEIGYYAGFGEKNAQGFGCVEVDRPHSNE